MEVMRCGFRLGYVQWKNTLGFDGNDMVLILQDAFDQDKFFTDQE